MSLCWLKDRPGECSTRLDPAHFCPQQRLKQALKTRGLETTEIHSILWDKRAFVFICRAHHHKLDQGFIRLNEEDYPEDFREFAAEHRIYWAGNDRGGWRVEA